MVAQAEDIEVLLHVSFGRGIKWLSVLINDSNYGDTVQQGEKICLAALKCFIVSVIQVLLEASANSTGLGVLCTG
jgi:hypothetical protein